MSYRLLHRYHLSNNCIYIKKGLTSNKNYHFNEVTLNNLNELIKKNVVGYFYILHQEKQI